MPKQTTKTKREPYTCTMVVNWIKPEDDPIRHAAYCRFVTETINKYLPKTEQKKDAA